MNIYFFFNNESCYNWYNCTIEAWEENDNTWHNGKRVSRFLQLERLKIHICKHPTSTDTKHGYHCCGLDHDSAADSCIGHYAKTKREFLKEMESGHSKMRRTDHKTFQRLKKAMLQIYIKYPPVNYTEHLLRHAPASRIMF